MSKHSPLDTSLSWFSSYINLYVSLDQFQIDIGIYEDKLG